MHSLLKATLFSLPAPALALALHSSSSLQTLIPYDNFTAPSTGHLLLLLSFLWCALLSLLAFLLRCPRPILLLDFSCHSPTPDRRCSYEVCEYFGMRTRRFSPASADFMRAIYRKSGLGDETYAPPFLFTADLDAKLPYAIVEAEEGLFSSVSSLLSKCDVPPSSLTHLIVACSMFSPSPSLASMLVNRLALPPSINSLNLAGMGCSAGAVALDLAARLLRSSGRTGYALIVVTENTTLNWYFGNDRHMLVTNCIFRPGTATALVTNDPARRPQAKMELVRTLRTHHGADDASYNAAIQKEDDEGNVGVALTKDLIRVAGAGLRDHIAALAPRVLPVSEMIRYALHVARCLVRGNRKAAAAHVPDFTTAFEHMCIHSGGKAVIDSVAKMMRFGPEVVEPARMCLHRFGNTSSALVFYELAYFEAKNRIKAGDRVWMIAFGTGFKVCSVVWRALRDSRMESDNPWKDCIHRYPV